MKYWVLPGDQQFLFDNVGVMKPEIRASAISLAGAEACSHRPRAGAPFSVNVANLPAA